MDRVERLLLRIAVLVVVVLIVREFVQNTPARPARRSGGGTMAVVW